MRAPRAGRAGVKRCSQHVPVSPILFDLPFPLHERASERFQGNTFSNPQHTRTATAPLAPLLSSRFPPLPPSPSLVTRGREACSLCCLFPPPHPEEADPRGDGGEDHQPDLPIPLGAHVESRPEGLDLGQERVLATSVPQVALQLLQQLARLRVLACNAECGERGWRGHRKRR